jgi:ubiquinone biosynthesis protein UbiJ
MKMKDRVSRILLGVLAVGLALAIFWFYSREKARMEGEQAARAFGEAIFGTEEEQAENLRRMQKETLEMLVDYRKTLVSRLEIEADKPLETARLEREIKELDAKIVTAEEALASSVGVKTE